MSSRSLFSIPKIYCIGSSFYSNIMSNKAGLILGVYKAKEQNGNKPELTASTDAFSASNNTFNKYISACDIANAEQGKCRVVHGASEAFASVALVNLGLREASFSEREGLDEARENVRAAVGAGVKQLRELGVTSIAVDPCGQPTAASEAAHLSVFDVDDFKSDRKPAPLVELHAAQADDSVTKQWQQGKVLADAQNLARRVADLPASHMTPTEFCKVAEERLGQEGMKCQLWARDAAWATKMKMGSFLSVSRGSSEPPKLLEISYQGASCPEEPHFALVGKGITFDSGGISLKAPLGMHEMRGDMGGGAAILGAIYAVAKLAIDLNIKAYIALTENMPGNYATKPGDVVTAMNGKTIQVDNTDAEGRLVLADALLYAQTFKPFAIMDLATLTGASIVALGPVLSAAYTNSSKLWTLLNQAGWQTGDRVWRMPLLAYYAKQMRDASHYADINNALAHRNGGSCTAAGFLATFVEHEYWLHMDIAGSAMDSADLSYLGKGMTGRPTRTVVQFLQDLSNDYEAFIQK